MIDSGLSLLRCLYVLEEQTGEQEARPRSSRSAPTSRPAPRFDALEKHPKVFNDLYVSMVRAGEVGGILDEVLNRVAVQLEKDDNIRRAVKSAMVYPVMIGIVRPRDLIGMVLFLIPIFATCTRTAAPSCRCSRVS